MKNLQNVVKALFIGFVFSTVIVACSKDKDEPSTDESAASRIVGTYKGTMDVTDSDTDYFDAIIVITKESGNKVKIAPKSGEPYSQVTPKIVPIQAILGSDDAASEGPVGILIYKAQEKSLKFLSKETASGDKTYSFEGTKQ